MTSINKASLSEQIYESIRNKIISQAYKSGDKLTIKELQDEFGVSNTPIREALARLDHEGLIEFTTNSSAKVYTFTRDDIVEINDLCALLDCYAVELAMKNFEEREALIGELNDIIKRDEKNDAVKTSFDWSTSFHAVFYKYAKHGRLKKMAQQYASHFLIIGRHQRPQDRLENKKQHLAILEALMSGDVDKTVDAMKQHYEVGKQRLLDYWA